MNATATTTDDLLARCVKAQSERLDPLDYPYRWTRRQANDYEQDGRSLAAAISVFRDAPDHLKKLAEQIATLEDQRAASLKKKAELEKQLAGDEDGDRQQHLARALQLLGAGNLLAAPGVCFAGIDAVDARIDALRREAASVQSQLGFHAHEAERLLAEPVAR